MYRHKYTQVNLWTCASCGKSFTGEKDLEEHISRRHPELASPGDFTICLADYCDILRCGAQVCPSIFVIVSDKYDMVFLFEFGMLFHGLKHRRRPLVGAPGLPGPLRAQRGERWRAPRAGSWWPCWRAPTRAWWGSRGLKGHSVGHRGARARGWPGPGGE